MDFELSLTIGTKTYPDAEVGLRAIGSELQTAWDGSTKVVSADLYDLLTKVAHEVAARNSGSYPSGTSSTSLSMRSGALVRAIVSGVSVRGTTMDTLVGDIDAGPNAAIHEFGGTITAKNSRFLAIPLKAALTARGLPKKPSPRSWANTFVAKTRSGNLVVFQKNLNSITPLYVLKTSVRIPARLGLRDTLNKNLPYFVDRMADNLVAQVMKGIH